jgi:hypothetical protein
MERTVALLSLAGWVSAALALPARVTAEDQSISPSAPAAPGALSAEQIALLCGQLGAADFNVREEATKQLIAGGKAVIDSVAAAAESSSLEVVMRCVRILRELYQQPEATVRAAAQAALERLAGSKLRAVARRASEILHPPAAGTTQRQQLLIGRVNPPANVFAINVVQAQAVAGRVMLVRTTNNNGNITIDAEEDGRKVVITHRDSQNIVVRVTEPPAPGAKEGKTTEYKAKDLDELKTKHPEAHALIEKYGGPAQRGALKALAPRIERQLIPVAPR